LSFDASNEVFRIPRSKVFRRVHASDQTSLGIVLKRCTSSDQRVDWKAVVRIAWSIETSPKDSCYGMSVPEKVVRTKTGLSRLHFG